MTSIRHLLPGAIRRAWPLVLAAAAGIAAAHGFSVGSLEIGHPFATPSIPGTTNGAAYFANLENKGDVPDRLVRAKTPVAQSVEMHTMAVDAQGVMRMREVDGIALAPKASIQMKPGAGMHLMLIGLKAPLKAGTTFPMTLEFERAGRVDVTVNVQAPKAGAADEMHMH
jgi:periplasmic copper chaperone A